MKCGVRHNRKRRNGNIVYYVLDFFDGDFGFSSSSFPSSDFWVLKCLSVGMGFEEPWLCGGGGTLLEH